MVHNYRLTIVLLILLTLALPATAYADTHGVDIVTTGQDPIGSTSVWCRLGQRLTIPDLIVTEIGYRIWRIGSPTGDVTLSVYNATTDEVIISELWGDASLLPQWPTDGGNVTKVVLDEPVRINGDVRLCVEYHGGDEENYCICGYYSGDRITGEWYTNYYHYGQWHDIGEAEEGGYHYAWIDPEDVKSNSSPLPSWIIAPIVLMAGGIWFYVNKRQHKKHEAH